jgi:hypothetical protein
VSGAEQKKKAAVAPSKVPEGAGAIPRSGSGAGTALLAMLKKRQMRATRDMDPELTAPGSVAKKAAKD